MTALFSPEEESPDRKKTPAAATTVRAAMAIARGIQRLARGRGTASPRLWDFLAPLADLKLRFSVQARLGAAPGLGNNKTRPKDRWNGPAERMKKQRRRPPDNKPHPPYFCADYRDLARKCQGRTGRDRVA